MGDLIQLTEAEIAAVGGGAINQAINVYADQANYSNVNQNAYAANYAPVTANAYGPYATAAAAGAEANNVALVAQNNAIVAANVVSFRKY
jgi:alcohol dehydrogenase YqhD (iron-dependent ADH family)